MRSLHCGQEGTAMGKRTNYISWDEYFMGIALLSAKRSKDPGTQVGACIVSANRKIVSVGYNGMPTGCSDDDFPWEREGEPLETKYPYVCHAELNAILNNLGFNLSGCTIYTPLFPCNECCKAIIQSGIRDVIYISDKYAETDSVRASKKMMDHAGLHYRRLESNLEELTISYRVKDV
jgi:dCMP deaminase